MTALPTHAAAAGRAAPQVVAAFCLLATAAMFTGYPLVPPLVWLAALIAVAIACAAASRRPRRPRRTSDRVGRAAASHLAIDPLAMAVMVAYGLFHAHEPAGTAASAAHTGHLAWLVTALAATTAALAIACPVLAVRHARRVGIPSGALPLLASAAMAVMAGWMLLPR